MPGPRKARIGDVLEKHGQLSPQQVAQILTVQEKDGRPFGELAQRLFGLSNQAIEAAWLDQYLTLDTRIDLDTQQIDPALMGLLTRRQAWQLQLLPLRRQEGRLLVATTQQRLVRSVNYVWRRLGEPVVLGVASSAALEEYLQRYYPWPAMAQRVDRRLVAQCGV